MRRVLALVAGAAAASVGAVILGEYVLKGLTPVVAGILVGVILAEIVTLVGRRRDAMAAAAAAVLAAACMALGAWISEGQERFGGSRWTKIAGLAWLGMVLAPVAAVLWIRTPGRRGAGTRRAP